MTATLSPSSAKTQDLVARAVRICVDANVMDFNGHFSQRDEDDPNVMYINNRHAGRATLTAADIEKAAAGENYVLHAERVVTGAGAGAGVSARSLSWAYRGRTRYEQYRPGSGQLAVEAGCCERPRQHAGRRASAASSASSARAAATTHRRRDRGQCGAEGKCSSRTSPHTSLFHGLVRGVKHVRPCGRSACKPRSRFVRRYRS